MANPNWKSLLIRTLLIVGVIFWIYQPTLHGTWLWDDDYLIENNEVVHDPSGIWSIWCDPTSLIDYFPLTVTVEWLEWQVWPGDPFIFHLTNVICHMISALLVWRLLSKLGLRLAWLGGLLFAIHPVQVESVAWMAEIKNTLSLPPFLLAACCWVDYERRGKLEDYYLTLCLFLVAMLCKTTMVMFPVVILLYAWWKRDRIGWRDIRNSAPFFVISLAIGVTLVALLRHGVGEETIPLGGVFSRLACSGISIAFYFSKVFLPIGLLPIYPQWNINPPSLPQLLPWPILGGVLYWLWSRRQKWARNILFGFGFFLLNLLPFVGFRTISFMRFAWVMDHFLYLPILGLIGLIVAGVEQVDDRLSASTRPYRIAGVAIVMGLLAFWSSQYARIFVNTIALWTYETQHYPQAWPSHNNLGLALAQAGRLQEAKVQYEEALFLNPGYPEAHNNLGADFWEMGQFTEAEEQFKEALIYCPSLESAQTNLVKIRGIIAAQAAAPKK